MKRHARAQPRLLRQPRFTPRSMQAHTLACQSSVMSRLGPFRSARPPKGHPRGATHNLGTNSSAAGLSSCHSTPQAAMPHCTAQHGTHSPRCSTTGEWECRACMPRAAPSACKWKQMDGWRLSNQAPWQSWHTQLQQLVRGNGSACVCETWRDAHQLQSAGPGQLRRQRRAACRCMQHIRQRAAGTVL